MAKLFALDLGNRQVKMYTELGVKVFPSYFIDAEEYGNRSLLKLKEGDRTTSDYVSSRDEDITYVWGRGLRIRNKFVRDSIRFDARYASREYKLLADFALAEMARDFDGVKTGDVLDVVLVAGIPTDDFNAKTTAEQLEKSLKGVHTTTVDGETIIVNVKEIHALPQPIGTYLDNTIDSDGFVLEESPLIDALVGIVDVGGGTIIVDALDDMNLQRDYHAQSTDGAYTLYERIRNVLNDKGVKINVYEVEAFIRAGHEAELYTWSPNNVETFDYTDLVMKERARYTERVITFALATFKDFSNMYQVIFTGGTSNLLLKPEVLKHVPNAIFSENSEVSNVRGFYKYGLNSELV